MKSEATTLFELRAKASGLRAQVKEINEEIEKRETQLLNMLSSMPLPEAYVTVPQGTIKAAWKSRPAVDDPLALREHIRSTGEFDLLQNRVSEAAIRERWEAGNTVPGVKRDDYLALSYSSNRHTT